MRNAFVKKIAAFGLSAAMLVSGASAFSSGVMAADAGVSSAKADVVINSDSFIKSAAKKSVKLADAGTTGTIEFGDLTSDGKLTVTGTAPSGYVFSELNVGTYGSDGTENFEPFETIGGKSTFSTTIDTTQFPVGYHDLQAIAYSIDNPNDEIKVYPETAFPSPILDKVTLKKNSDYLVTGSNYINYRPYFTVNTQDYDGVAVWLSKGKTIGKTYRATDSYNFVQLKKFDDNTNIKADTNYDVSTAYYKITYYGGETYPMYGPVAKASVKTGKAKTPAVKSVTAKCTKTVKKKLWVEGYWSGGQWHSGHYATVYTSYVTFTVKLKSAPGTKGIVIAGDKAKGNKKTYTLKTTYSGKMKGKTVKVGIYSYNDNNVGAFSPTTTKKVKIK